MSAFFCKFVIVKPYLLQKTMQQIDDYREAIVQALLQKHGDDGLPVLIERDARKLVDQLTDEELEDGIDFNTAEEVADWLLED